MSLLLLLDQTHFPRNISSTSTAPLPDDCCPFVSKCFQKENQTCFPVFLFFSMCFWLFPGFFQRLNPGFPGFVQVSPVPPARFYLTGHSLGGGLAKLVALEVGRKSATGPKKLGEDHGKIVKCRVWMGNDQLRSN